ncbi:Fc.00g016410.m01.CDS01 [Cosmosporella sp. VM-42]
MAPNPEDGQLKPGEKALHVWAKPIEQPGNDEKGDGATPSNQRPTLSEAVGMIKTEDFTNIPNTPCARQGLLTGIASGAGIGGLKFVINGNVKKATNWAVGFFVLGSMASYEYCQYLRRAERIQMKRHIEVVTENRKEQAKKLAEAKKEQLRLQQERKAAEKAWYKFW